MISSLLKEDENLNPVFLILFWAPIRCMCKSTVKATLDSSQSNSLVSVVCNNISPSGIHFCLGLSCLPQKKIKCDELSNLNNEKLFSHSLDAGSLKIKGPVSSDSRGRSSSLCVWWSPSMSHMTLPQFAWVWWNRRILPLGLQRKAMTSWQEFPSHDPISY